MIAVHVTHEAVEKMGGIGAVIAGLVTSPAYQKSFTRTILVGPLFSTDHPGAERLGLGGRVLYSSLDDIDAGPEHHHHFRGHRRHQPRRRPQRLRRRRPGYQRAIALAHGRGCGHQLQRLHCRHRR